MLEFTSLIQQISNEKGENECNKKYEDDKGYNEASIPTKKRKRVQDEEEEKSQLPDTNSSINEYWWNTSINNIIHICAVIIV